LTIGFLSVALSWILSLLGTATQQQVVQTEDVWIREGLAGREVRALAVAPDSGTLAALVSGSSDGLPLWYRDTQNWATASQSPSTLLLALAPMPDGGLLLGVGRDLTDQPGVYWSDAGATSPRRLYDGQAVGALATFPGPAGTEILAAAAPWADRDAGADLVRRDPTSGVWSVILHGNLTCRTGPSYFRQLVVVEGEPSTLLALEWCVAAVNRQTQLWRSNDRGQSWQVLDRRGDNDSLISAVAADPTNGNVLYLAERARASENGGLQRSLDGGETWEARGESWPELADVRTLLIDRRKPRRVLAGTDHNGVFVSDDRGDTWRPLPGLEEPRIWSLLIDEGQAQLYAATADGIWRTNLP
jgi:hypothetical protein